MDEDQKKQRDEMIARANVAVQGAAIEFVSTLNKRVSDLEKVIIQNDREMAAEMAYNIETEASTFGWPRVTRICKWLRKVFSGEFDQKPEAEVVLKALNALKLMVADPDHPNEQRDSDLFQELYPDLKNIVSDI